MRIIIKTFILFLFTISFFIAIATNLFIPVRLSYAQSNYVVKPVILIPNDWKDRVTPQEIDQYKRGVLNNLSRAQGFFAGKLNGKTFNLEQSVDVVYSPKNIEGNDENTIAAMFDFLNKETILVFDRPLINSESGKVKVIWIIGSKVFGGIYAQAHPVSGFVFMPYEDLLRASGITADFDRQQFSRASLAHELGHTFGLVLSGYAKGHPCTEVSPDQCIAGAPQPYPPESEWTSIMGYGFPYDKFPDIHLNNSLFNPEIQKIYASPFINPQNDPAPEPAPGLATPVINDFKLGNLTVTAGTVITFNNTDKMFGENPGKVEFLSPPELTLALGEDNYELQVWDSKKIQILIKESAESSTTKRRWKLKLTTPEGKTFQSDEIIIQGKYFGKPAFYLTATLLTTCGQEKRPVSASLNFTGPSASGTVGTSVKTDSLTGKGEVSLGLEGPEAGNQYHLTPYPLPEVPETPEEKTITLESSDIEAGQKVVNVDIHYPTCPGSISTPLSLQELRPTTKSKLGIQTDWQKPGVMAFIEAAQPVVVKLTDDFDKVAEIKQKSPGTFIIGKIYEANQPFDREPETRAQEWFNRNRGTLEAGSIDCWEGYNEPPTNNPDEIANMQWYSRFETKRMQLLESIGKKACIGNFSTANPDFSSWQYFRGAIDYATPRGHYLGLHEYGPTTMSDRSDDFSLRHRRVYRENNFTLPLIISETGIDSGGCDDCKNPQNGCGWKAHTKDATDYFDQLKWYDERLQEDSYVKGATIFGYGLYNWCSFDIYLRLVGADGSGSLTDYIRGDLVPTPSAPAPTGAGTKSPGKILISNYADFRDSNAPRDMGSPTITINNPNGQTVIWTLNTLDSSKKPIYVRTISGEDYNDYRPVEMGDGDTIEIAGIKIQAKMVKKIVKMTVIINGENRFVDLNSPQDITVRLPGTEGRTQTFSIPYILEYSNGEVTRSALEINYQPDSFTSPTPVSTFQCIGDDGTKYNPGDYEKKCTGNCIRNGCSPGNYTGGEQVFRQCGANGVWGNWQSQCNNTDCGQFCNSIPTSPPQCTEINSYNECISCNTSRRVSKDSCGNYKIVVESQYDSACSSWCTVPEPTGCSAQPPSRGKTWVLIREGAGYFCGYGGADVCNAQGHSGTCVGVPWECQNGQWVESNPYGECTTVCTDCR